MVEAFTSVQVGESDRSVLLVLAKYLQGGWSSLGPKDKAALGQDPYDLMGRPFDKAAARTVMADSCRAMTDRCFSMDATRASMAAIRPVVTKQLLSSLKEAESRESRFRSLPWPVRSLVSFLRTVL